MQDNSRHALAIPLSSKPGAITNNQSPKEGPVTHSLIMPCDFLKRFIV